MTLCRPYCGDGEDEPSRAKAKMSAVPEGAQLHSLLFGQ